MVYGRNMEDSSLTGYRMWDLEGQLREIVKIKLTKFGLFWLISFKQLQVYLLEKEMATHSSVLAWRIPGTEKPGGCCLWGCTELDTTEVT